MIDISTLVMAMRKLPDPQDTGPNYVRICIIPPVLSKDSQLSLTDVTEATKKAIELIFVKINRRASTTSDRLADPDIGSMIYEWALDSDIRITTINR
jgi:hypothetical protein